LPTGANVVGVVAGTVPEGEPVAGEPPKPEVGGVVAGVALPAPSVRFESTVLARPGWAQAATAVKPAAPAIEAATTVRVTIEIRRRPASRACKRLDRDSVDRDNGERGDVGDIESRIGA